MPSNPKSLQEYRRIIDLEIDKFGQPEAGMPPEYGLALREAATSRGKRIRSMITLLSCQAAGGPLTAAVEVAAAVELLHTASLVLDDIVDEDTMRRGQPALHARFGSDLAMMVAGVIVTRALVPIVENRTLARATLDTMNKAIIGEILDIRGEIRTVDAYLNLVGRKTAALFQLAAEMGAVCADARAEHRELYGNYGLNVGIVFQIRDDVLDAIGEANDLGKPVGSDVRNGSPSIVSILASERLDVPLNELPQALGSLDADRCRACLHHASEAAMHLCGQHAEQAESSLAQLENTRYRDLLHEILCLAMSRST